MQTSDSKQVQEKLSLLDEMMDFKSTLIHATKLEIFIPKSDYLGTRLRTGVFRANKWFGRGLPGSRVSNPKPFEDLKKAILSHADIAINELIADLKGLGVSVTAEGENITNA